MFQGALEGNKVIVESAEAIQELYHTIWYGDVTDGRLELSLVEALSLLERKKIEISSGSKKLSFQEFFGICSKDTKFLPHFIVYRDLRERGLPVRIGFKGSDFRVYERGAKPEKVESVKWIVFTDSEDYTCELNKLTKAIQLAENIRAEALWAVVDNDTDVTYYIIKHAVKL